MLRSALVIPFMLRSALVITVTLRSALGILGVGTSVFLLEVTLVRGLVATSTRSFGKTALLFACREFTVALLDLRAGTPAPC